MTRPRPRTLALALVGGALLLACRPDGGTQSPATPWQDASYRRGRPDPAAKVFLVAGGDDIANFAAEVVEQRALWKAAGLRDEEIACYWAHPTARAYREDRQQYDALADALDDCFAAEPATVFAHLRRAAELEVPWVYVFVSSHGLPDLMRWLPGRQASAARRWHLDPTELEALDHHAIGLEAGPGPGLEDVDRIVQGHRAGAPRSTLMLSPPTLAEALAVFPASTSKYVVLQACFSGGFIETDAGPSAVAAVPNTTIMTAASHDRPSFGCGAGKAKTYFGGSFNQVLAHHLHEGVRPPDLPWPRMYEEVGLVVDALESIDAETPSRPGFLQTSPAADEPEPPAAD